MDKYAYLLINIFTVLGPLALSPLAPANQKAFLKKIFPSILIIAAIFIIHDIVFTDLGVWGFNYFYLTGMNIFNLPVEEVLFFICIPFGSLFIHATVTVQKPKWKIADSFLNIFSYSLVVILMILAFTFSDRIYTLHSFITSAVLIIICLLKHKELIAKFYVSYAFILIPFLVVNGLLTGSLIENEIVWYNSMEMIGTRIGTIPVEDFSYGFSLLLSILIIDKYQIFTKKRHKIN